MDASQQQIRFCTAPDGTRLAYATVGAGPPLVKVANWLTHLEHDWTSPMWRHVLAALSKEHTLIRYDERGCGLSDWAVDDFSLEAWVQDLETVMDALGLERVPLLGISQGGPVAIAYAARHPERVSHLILYGCYLRGLFHVDLTGAREAERLFDQAVAVDPTYAPAYAGLVFSKYFLYFWYGPWKSIRRSTRLRFYSPSSARNWDTWMQRISSRAVAWSASSGGST